MEYFKDILRRYWGYPDFRGIQRDIIESVARGEDTLGLMPTGGGKSIAFQVPALAMEGMCLVVTPLIALMKDQVAHLRERGIPAAAVYSGLPQSEVSRHLDNAVLGAYKFLYLSPERLCTEAFRSKVRRMRVCLLTVDEAHCISQWGYDFRPPYLHIADVRDALPGVPVLALTATATARVAQDIQERLGFRRSNVFRMSFERKNICYVVRHTDNKFEELLHILASVEGSAIVYTRSRGAAKQIAEDLNSAGVTALHYHAGLTPTDKDTREKAWRENHFRVMVATNAFGMGIDKPDVRLVAHTDFPDSVEAYYQEAGRAGRDGRTAYAVLLYNQHDRKKLLDRVRENYPERAYIRKVYDDLCAFYQIAEGEAQGRTFEFDRMRFCTVFHHFPVTLTGALNLLTQAGYILYQEDSDSLSRLIVLTTRDELYHVDYLTPAEDRVLNAVLRLYAGLFADYVFVREDTIGAQCGMTAREVYEALVQLRYRRIINYVPRKNVPRITYTTRRVDTKYVEMPHEIYESRKSLYEKQVKAIWDYANENSLCRSRYLLQYFGDEADDCGHCDLCWERRGRSAEQRKTDKEKVDELEKLILHILSDGKEHDASELPDNLHPRRLYEEALRRLADEEAIEFVRGKIHRC